MPNTPDEQASQPNTRPDHHGLGVKHPAASKRKRGLFSRLLRLGMLLLALLVLLVALGPILLSTGPGTRLLVSLVNRQIDGEVSITDLRLSWLKGQQVQGLSFVDKQIGVQADVAWIDAPDIGLFDLVTGSRRLGTITFTDVDLVYDQPGEAKRKDPREEPQPDQERAPLTLPAALSCAIVLDDVMVAYRSPQQEPVVLTLPWGTLEMPDVRDIRFDVDASLKQGEQSGRVVLKGELLNLFDPDGVAQPMKAGYAVQSGVTGLSTSSLDQLVSGMVAGVRPGLITAVLGGGEVTANADINGTVSELSAELHASAPNGRIDLYQEREGDTLLASERSSAYLDLTPEAVAALLPDSELELVEQARVQLSRLQMRLPRRGDAFDWDGASVSIEVKAADDHNLALRDPAGKVIGIDGLLLGGGGTSIAEQLKFEVSAMLSAVDAQGAVTREPVKAVLVVNKPMDTQRQIEFFSEALPLALADKLGGMNGQLVLWLGQTLELQAQLQGRIVTDAKGNTQLVRSFSLRPGPTGRITGEVTGELSANQYTISTPKQAPLEATLTPEAFASVMAMLSGKPDQPVLTIDQPMPVRITLREGDRPVSITTDASKTGVKRYFPDPDRTVIGATIELTPARVYDPNQKTYYELRGGTLAILVPDLRGKAQISAEIQLKLPRDAGKQGVVSLLTWQTSVANLLGSDGGIPLDGLELMQQIRLDGGVTLANAPAGLFDALLNRNGDIASILGPVVEQMQADFNYADGQPTGASLRLNWDDANNQPLPGAWASMKPVQFDIDADQMMTVRGGQDLQLEVKVSEAFGNRWMGQLHPILFDVKSGDRPVRVTISGGSFRFPLNDPTMKKARVEAQVDLGSLAFGKDALLGKLLEWTGVGLEHAIFSPAHIALVDGNISYDALDLTVGNVRLRLDGEVNLVDGQIVDMAVRVPGESLIRVFKELDGIIAKDDYLSIPMSGPIRRPQFDRQLMTREVTRLVAKGLIDKQKDSLKDKIRDEIGIDKDQPGGDVIDNALDLIFGGRKKQDEQNKNPEDKR